MATERRSDLRVPVDMYATQFIDNRPYRSAVSDLSTTGVHLSRLSGPMWRSSRIIQVELPLPGTDDSIWAKAEVVYDALDPFFHGSGIHFVAMAGYHERLLGDWIEHARQLVLSRMMQGIQTAQAA